MRFVHRDALTENQRALLDAAEKVSQNANCRFSGYPVGAALRIVTPDGREEIVTGNNYETQTFNSVCAEKHALLRAWARFATPGPDGTIQGPRVVSVAVYCAVGVFPQQPCGICRQDLHESNPDMEVIAAAGPGNIKHAHDSRVSITTVRELLPYGFVLEPRAERAQPPIYDDTSPEAYVVHFPLPEALKQDRAARTALLEGVSYLVMVGSPRRARKIAQLAHDVFGASRTAEESCYCDLTVPGRDESSREYAVYSVDLPGGARVAVASHGIGRAGAEIVLSELPALIAVIQGGQVPQIHGVLRSGTRATTTQLPLGFTALSTLCSNDHLETVSPDEHWVAKLREAARTRGMHHIAEEDIAAYNPKEGPEPSKLFVEGRGVSSSFFWEGQGRPLFRAGVAPLTGNALREDQWQRVRKLQGWVDAGVKWIEMEDYTVLDIARACGLPAASVGAVIAQRQGEDGTFQLDYSHEALARSEMIPPTLVLQAILDDFAERSGSSSS